MNLENKNILTVQHTFYKKRSLLNLSLNPSPAEREAMALNFFLTKKIF